MLKVRSYPARAELNIKSFVIFIQVLTSAKDSNNKLN